MTAPEKPVKQEEMAALDVDSGGGGPHGEYLQQGNGASAATSADASDEAGTTQDTQPSPLALLAATCSKIGPPSPEEDDAASPSAGALSPPGTPQSDKMKAGLKDRMHFKRKMAV